MARASSPKTRQIVVHGGPLSSRLRAPGGDVVLRGYNRTPCLPLLKGIKTFTWTCCQPLRPQDLKELLRSMPELEGLVLRNAQLPGDYALEVIAKAGPNLKILAIEGGDTTAFGHSKNRHFELPPRLEHLKIWHDVCPGREASRASWRWQGLGSLRSVRLVLGSRSEDLLLRKPAPHYPHGKRRCRAMPVPLAHCVDKMVDFLRDGAPDLYPNLEVCQLPDFTPQMLCRAEHWMAICERIESLRETMLEEHGIALLGQDMNCDALTEPLGCDGFFR